ncbi:hypothetical protein ACFOGJ_30130 [Marinibaculum pumilum]|uniref:Sel1 repeat family protein n=1 Tax=Marinibaculum pumilum TaxID=1766165 RepID=A0ABV7LAL0_9PROT
MSGSVRARPALFLPALFLLALLLLAWPAPGGALAGFEEGLRAYQRGDFPAAFEEWIELARDGDPAAMRNVGHLYRWGQGVPQDLAAAADWYRRAAEMGLDRAQANLAMMYLQGQGVEEDPAQAAYWFSQAAIQGHTVAQYNLAQLYQQGRGVQRNEALALGWLQRAAKAGHPEALAQLGALVAEAPPPDPGLQKREGPADPPPAAPPTTPPAIPAAPPQPSAADGATAAAAGANPTAPVDTDGEESLETPASSESPEIVDRLAGVFGGASEESPPPLPTPRPDAESGALSPRVAARPPPSRDAEETPPSADSRSDAENWVLALITDAISPENAPATPAAPQPPATQPLPAEPATQGAAPPSPVGTATPGGTDAASAAPGDLGPLEGVAPQALQAYRAGDYGMARTELQPLADAGVGRAQYLLGWLNEQGLGAPADPATAYYWYMRASTGGDFEGRRALEDLQRRIDPAAREAARNRLIRGR